MRNRRIVAIVQARMGSTRLPGKVLEKIGDKTILEILVGRLRKSKLIDEIVVATTVKEVDDAIVNLSRALDVKYFRGSEEDVLKRYDEAARKFGADIVVRVTADNPLTDPELMDRLIDTHIDNNAQYTYSNDAPLGAGTEIIDAITLSEVDRIAKLPSEREHVTTYIKAHPKSFRIQVMLSHLGDGRHRLTVDTREDLERVGTIHSHLGDLVDLETEEILSFLNLHREIYFSSARTKQRPPIMADEQNGVEITIIVRTHNSKDFVGSALDSVLNQTLSRRSYEVLVVDDGSSDSTRDLLKKYGDQIRIIEVEGLGAIKAANLGMKEAKGKYVVLLDSDDTFEPNALEGLFDSIKDNNADFAYCDYYELDKDSDIIRIVSLKENILDSVAGGILFKKSVTRELGYYDESLYFPEYDLLMKLLRRRYRSSYVPTPLFTYVRHRESMTANRNLVDQGLKQLSEKYGEIKGLKKY